MIDVDAELARAVEDDTIDVHVRAVIAALIRARREVRTVAADVEVVTAIREHRQRGAGGVAIIRAVARALRARAPSYART